MGKSDAPLKKTKMMISSASDSEGGVHVETFSRPVECILFNKDSYVTCKFRVTREGYITDMLYNCNGVWQLGKP